MSAEEHTETGTLAAAVGDLIDALSDELKHEINYSVHVQEHIRAVVALLGDPRYDSYLDSWWLGGDDGIGQFDDDGSGSSSGGDA